MWAFFIHQPIRTRSPGCSEECSLSAAGLFCVEDSKTCVIEKRSPLPSASESYENTYRKPGFPCKSLRITLKVTQRDDQYACVVLLPTISQHGSCKFISSVFSRKTLTYLKLTLYSLAPSVRKKRGNLGVGNCRAHLPMRLCFKLVTGTFFFSFLRERSVMCACL